MTICLKVYVNSWWKPLTVSFHLAMFGGHCSSASGNIKYFICHVTSQNDVIEGSIMYF